MSVWSFSIVYVLKKARKRESDDKTIKALMKFYNVSRRLGEFRMIEDDDLRNKEAMIEIRNAVRSSGYQFGFVTLFVFGLGIFMLVAGEIYPFKILSIISAPILSLGVLFSWLLVKLIDERYSGGRQGRI